MGAAPKFLQSDRTVGSKLFGVNEPLYLIVIYALKLFIFIQMLSLCFIFSIPHFIDLLWDFVILIPYCQSKKLDAVDTVLQVSF